AVHRDGGAAAGVALVERTGPGVAGQHREDAAAQLAHGRRGGRVVRGAQQLVAEHAGERVVERGQVAGGVRGVVGQVVLDVERDGDGRRGGMLRGPGVDHGEPVAQQVRGGVPGVVHEVAGGVVADRVVAVGRVPVVVDVELDEPDALVELADD